ALPRIGRVAWAPPRRDPDARRLGRADPRGSRARLRPALGAGDALLLPLEALDAERRVSLRGRLHGREAPQVPRHGVAKGVHRAVPEVDRGGRWGLPDHALPPADGPVARAGARLHPSVRRGSDPALPRRMRVGTPSKLSSPRPTTSCRRAANSGAARIWRGG